MLLGPRTSVFYSRASYQQPLPGSIRESIVKSATLEFFLNLDNTEFMLIEYTFEQCKNDIITAARTPGADRPKIYPYSPEFK